MESFWNYSKSKSTRRPINMVHTDSKGFKEWNLGYIPTILVKDFPQMGFVVSFRFKYQLVWDSVCGIRGAKVTRACCLLDEFSILSWSFFKKSFHIFETLEVLSRIINSASLKIFIYLKT